MGKYKVVYETYTVVEAENEEEAHYKATYDTTDDDWQVGEMEVFEDE